MSDNPSAPVTTEKKTYASDPVPGDYPTWSNNDKLQWLDSQGFANDPTINLGDCYRSSAKITQIFTVITKLLQRVYASLREKAGQSLRKAFSTFLIAYNQSIGRLSNEIYANTASLLSTGRFNNESNIIEPVSIPDLPIENDDGTSNIVATVSGFKDVSRTPPFQAVNILIADMFDQKIWPYFLNLLELLQDKWKWLSKVHPAVNASYSNLIKAMTDAGETVFLEYQKEEDRSVRIGG